MPYVTNTGIAFGFLQGNNVLMGVVSAAVAAFIVRYRKDVKGKLESAALALILGGTLSNLIDRIFRGAVIDYINIAGIPMFNLADAALTAGAAFIITAFLAERMKKK